MISSSLYVVVTTVLILVTHRFLARLRARTKYSIYKLPYPVRRFLRPASIPPSVSDDLNSCVPSTSKSPTHWLLGHEDRLIYQGHGEVCAKWFDEMGDVIRVKGALWVSGRDYLILHFSFNKNA